MTEQLEIWDEPAPELPPPGSLRWLGLEGMLLEVEGEFMVDHRARRLVELVAERGIEEVIRL